jgi:hypothetical protein
VGVIQQRTGDTREEIEAYLDRVVHGGVRATRQAMQKSVEQHPLSSLLVASPADLSSAR